MNRAIKPLLKLQEGSIFSLCFSGNPHGLLCYFFQTFDWFAYIHCVLRVSQCFKSLRTWVVHVLALTDLHTLSNVSTLKGWQALSSQFLPPFLLSTVLLVTLTGRVIALVLDIVQLSLTDWPSFLPGWQGPQWTRFYRDAACAQLPSPTSLFFNYWTSTRGGSSVIYGPLPPQRTYNYLSKNVIVLISHVRCGHPLPCPRGVSMEIESQLPLNDITDPGLHFGLW